MILENLIDTRMDEIRRLVNGDEDLLRNVVIDGIYGLSRMLVLRGEVEEGIRIAEIGVKFWYLNGKLQEFSGKNR